MPYYPDILLQDIAKAAKMLSGPRSEKTCLREFANSKGADQPAHPRSLISIFVIRLLNSVISMLAKSEILFFKFASVADQAGLNLTLSVNPKDKFSRVGAHQVVQLLQ